MRLVSSLDTPYRETKLCRDTGERAAVPSSGFGRSTEAVKVTGEARALEQDAGIAVLTIERIPKAACAI